MRTTEIPENSCYHPKGMYKSGRQPYSNSYTETYMPRDINYHPQFYRSIQIGNKTKVTKCKTQLICEIPYKIINEK
jgi:hypothetical protein